MADTDQKKLISKKAGGAPAKTGPAKGALQNVAMPAGGHQRRKKQPGSKAGRLGVKAGSMAANAGSSASSARVTAEAGQPGKRDGQDGQGLAGAKGKKAAADGKAEEVCSPLRSQEADVPGASVSSCQGQLIIF